ncbi:hypothetical protein Bca4012_083630 [Brassica carinata]|uniref:Uncharacterized protein n=1 Tax=Brassica carinata TaxID=52824 RepID=A0A8X7SJN9_BRACI|nr:hypothetical protein Bca52824_027095 [Brassica carinata]
MLDCEANQTTAACKLIQEGYMEDSSSRCLGCITDAIDIYREACNSLTSNRVEVECSQKVIDPLPQ